MANSEEEAAILGRTHGDAERLFPRKTNAFAAATSEVEVNGKVLKIWEYAQLETLSGSILRQRVKDIRDAVGEAYCPPMPSAQIEEMIRWILHMQAELVGQTLEVGHPKMPGRGCAVPAHFLQEAKERPIAQQRPQSPRDKPVPFGPRSFDNEHRGKRDSYRDLKEEAREFADVDRHLSLGIQSMRPGGEGKKHIMHGSNMVGVGVSTSAPLGIQTLKEGGEGRRYLRCQDNVADQKREMEALNKGYASAPPAASRIVEPQKHVSHTNMASQGVAAPAVEPHIGGERRRHAQPQDHMISTGMSGTVEDPKSIGRKHLDCFAGSRHKYGDAHDSYQATWKKDPSRLHGTSLII